MSLPYRIASLKEEGRVNRLKRENKSNDIRDVACFTATTSYTWLQSRVTRSPLDSPLTQTLVFAGPFGTPVPSGFAKLHPLSEPPPWTLFTYEEYEDSCTLF